MSFFTPITSDCIPGDVEALKELLGHRSTATTQAYLPAETPIARKPARGYLPTRGVR